MQINGVCIIYIKPNLSTDSRKEMAYLDFAVDLVYRSAGYVFSMVIRFI
jgi:hypothetical protein